MGSQQSETASPPNPLSPERKRLRAKHNGLKKAHGPDAPQVLDARRDLAAARLEDYITRTVDAAPPLSSEQRDKLALLLRGAA